jgi:ferredoxin-NADP reductase
VRRTIDPEATMKNNKATYVVQHVQKETEDTRTLQLTLEDNSIPLYVPGQFMSVYFPETTTPEGKAYSISSAPGESTINITVKATGEFSGKLCSMVEGDKILASLPYGFFHSDQEATDLVMIAAGIGITPFRGMIIHALHRTPKRKLSLFYSNKKSTDIVFADFFTELCAKEKITIHHFITEEDHTDFPAACRRITTEDILTKHTKKESEFFICGGASFVRNLHQGLKQSGISEEHIYSEVFFVSNPASKYPSL